MSKRIKINKITVIFLAALFLVGVGIWRLVIFNKPATKNLPDKSQNQIQNQNQTQNQSEDFVFNGTFRGLLTQHRSLQCAADYTANGQTQKQIVYCDGKNLRIDISNNTKEGISNLHGIISEGWQYLWDDKGWGVKAREFQAQSGTNEVKTFASLIPRITMDYSCSPWVVDASMLEIPSGVSFEEISAPEIK